MPRDPPLSCSPPCTPGARMISGSARESADLSSRLSCRQVVPVVMTRPFLVLVALVISASLVTPPVAANHEYEQPVWFTWTKLELDVMVLGVNDPVIGKAIRDGIARWEFSIKNNAPAWLANGLKLRVYNPTLDPLPPSGFQPTGIDIYVVPQGFMAIRTANVCVSTAPMIVGWGNLVKVVMHEFGHCLGLGHIFNHGQEYEPSFDVMGGATSGSPPCPSNLNLRVLERVYGGVVGQPSGGRLTISASQYVQPACVP
jgi:hypothetical protein